MALGSLIKKVEGLAEGIEHHIPKTVADELKPILRAVGLGSCTHPH